ncbi:MAG: hypothetical protein PUE16_09630 [Lactimicrobium massiliense]|nr:hypothetical protein [Lactimicrobium massiliense]MDD6727577.1 hypothetical protein [Lactimicrobium massiliense]
MRKYQNGQKVWFIQSRRYVREAAVVSYGNDFYVIRYSNGGGIRLREDRLYSSFEAAQEAVNEMGAWIPHGRY